MGYEVMPNDFILMNPANDRKPIVGKSLHDNLKRVIKHSGLEDDLAQEGKKLSLYKLRHFFITMRLRYGKVPLYLLSKVVGICF